MVDMVTIGAGGGSIARVADGTLTVGPQSAGADPGPAAYGRGGAEATVTDAHVVLGHLPARLLGGRMALDVAAASRAVDSQVARPLGLTREEAARGMLAILDNNMMGALRIVSVERGHDPRDFTLVPFGGAGPLHAAAIAAELGIARIVVPRASGVLSALGLLVSERRRDLAESVLLSGDELTREAVTEAVERLAARGRAELLGEGEAATTNRSDAAGAGGAGGAGGLAEPEVRASFDMRYRGQAFELTIRAEVAPDPLELRSAFDEAHAARYGFADGDAELELVTVRVAIALPGAEPRLPGAEPAETRSRSAIFDGQAMDAAVHSGVPERVEGPAIVELPEATLVVPPGWSGRALAGGTLLLERG
jgi:N-methylhydantoinase A